MKFTAEQEQFVRDNWQSMSNRELAEAMGLKLTSMRTAIYKLGLKKMELEYFTEEMTKFVLDNYTTMGDTEMAEYFQKHHPKKKPWTHKHIQTKRRNMKLKRTIAQLGAINDRNAENGSFSKNHWRSKAENNYPVGCVKEQDGKMMIKQKDGKFKPYAPILYKQHFGEVPHKHVVSFKDGNPLNCVPENLVAKTRNQLIWESRRKQKEKAAIKPVKVIIEQKPSHQEKILSKMIDEQKPVKVSDKITIWVPKHIDPELAKQNWLRKMSQAPIKY